MRRAVRSFASTTLGGADTGARRYGAVALSGADLISAVRSSGGLATELVSRGVDLQALRGAPLDAVVSAIAEVLAPAGIDQERIKEAIREALFEILGENETFDLQNFGGLDENQLLILATRYIETTVFLHIQQESGSSMDKATSPMELIKRENQLRDLVHVTVNQSVSGRLGGQIKSLAKADLEAAHRAIVADVLGYWESDDD